jgi:hypothetical protein
MKINMAFASYETLGILQASPPILYCISTH